MRALTYQGANNVSMDTVPDPGIIAPDDMILRVTATAICGSDLHILHGKIPGMKDGDILGHEFMGVVEEVGSEVTRVKAGDRVVIPFVIACGQCFHCLLNEYAACETTNSGPGAAINPKSIKPPAALFGYSHMYGGIAGGQAELVRVPKANVGPLVVPDVLSDEQVLFLSDILPTGYQAVLNAGVKPGSTLAIFGAGPVGCMAAACARMLGAETIYIVDHNPYRLEFARDTYGVLPINFDQDNDPAELIIQATQGRGVDACIDAVGFEAKGSTTETVLTTLKLEGSSGKALRQCIAATRRGGTVSVPGVYAGFIHGFLFGDAFDKGLTFKMGQTHVQGLMPELLEAIGEGRLKPEVIISHRMKLQDAVRGYELFDKRQDNCRKVVLTP
ncbi:MULTISPECIES: zinc-dependent alcohol dehydrogenase [unclassified Stenotrophomonas]|uniref:zinc-dependent alcohol dehydrogenase n=1 Tax=unclassified Stenotrophomonas TaxID=196198 RepID=UPI0025CF478C|nr:MULTISPECIES: zinc-dependent alcohol dehydrogenase [unclassified Stenotrophomonas]